MKKVQQGFTLIELMIVVAIIGILAAIAIPQYQTFIAKSQVSRVVGESGALKTAIEDCLNNGQLVVPAYPAAAADGECDLGRTVSSIIALPGIPVVATPLSSTSTIISTFGNKASTALAITGAPAVITWRRTVEGSWTCTSTAAPKYNTAACGVAAP